MKKLCAFSSRTSLAVLTALIVLATAAIIADDLFGAPRAKALNAKAPEFTHTAPGEWINSPPLTLSDLRGNVVLLDFWTFGCWNCYRSFPWLKEVEAAYEAQGLRVIGVHTPEFDHEKVRANVVEKVAKFELHHPVMIDNDFSYWNALNNRYWPAFYLIDKRGFLRSVFIGETHRGDANAKNIETMIRRLLAEKH